MTTVTLKVKDKAGNLSAATQVTINWQKPGPVLGMNFEPDGAIATFNAPYEPRAQAARIYVSAGQTNITKEDEFVRAADLGIRTIVASSKDTSTVPGWYGTFPKGFTWYGINHHEPENDIPGSFTVAQWLAWQALHLPSIRKAGGTPAICLMSYTVNPVSKRNVTDYKLPAGLADIVFWDYYPDKEPKPTQAQTIARLRAGTTALGLTRQGLAEYGLLHGSTVYTPAYATELRSLTPDFEMLLYWSNKQAEDQTFTPAVADAFFAA